MLEPSHIFLTGTDFAGRRSTFRALTLLSTPRFATSNDVDVLHADLGTSFALLRSRIHTAKTYDPIVDAGRDPRIAADVAFLARADLVVYVVDSQTGRAPANVAGLGRLHELLIRLGRRPDSIQVLFQLNKRDLPDLCSQAELRQQLTWPLCRYVETIATRGTGVPELALELARMIA